MYVPPFLPEQVDLPNCVATDSYSDRLKFLRRLMLSFSGSIAVVAGAAMLGPPAANPAAIGVACVLTLLALSVARTVGLRSEPWFPLISVMFGTLLVLLGWLVRVASIEILPAWSPIVGLVVGLTYGLVSGRDYSFVSHFSIQLFGGASLLPLIGARLEMTGLEVAAAIGLNSIFSLYFTYDLAALLSRRMKHETLDSTIDLYRDVFNVFGYIKRVAIHWREYGILNR